MPPIFTDDEAALIKEWIDNEPRDVANIQTQQGIAQDLLAKTQLEDGIYTKMRTDAIEQQDAILQAKAAALDISDSAYTHTVDYLSGHPSLGGTDMTAWQISHVDEFLQTIIDYSPTVNWDNNAGILSADFQWSVFYDWKVNTFYGTDLRISGLSEAVTQLANKLTAIQNRYTELV